MHCQTQYALEQHLSQEPLGAAEAGGWTGTGRWLGRFSISISPGPDVDLVTVRGELDIAGAGPLHQCLSRLDGRHVVVDARRLAFIDAAGMSALVIAHGRAVRRGRSLVVRRARGEVRRVLDLAGLAHLLDDRVQ